MSKYSYHLAWSDEDELYVATTPEFSRLVGVGETPEEALSELTEAVEMAIEVYKEDGLSLPEPIKHQAYSGQLRLRLPSSLHARLATQASREGVSLNTLIVQYLSESTGQSFVLSQLSRLLLQRPETPFMVNWVPSTADIVFSGCSTILDFREKEYNPYGIRSIAPYQSETSHVVKVA